MNQQNGSHSNNRLMLNSPPTASQTDSPAPIDRASTNGKFEQPNTKFDQPVILQQSSNWSRAILWTIMGVTTFGLVWASVAKIEQAVPAQGKLEPQGAVKEVQAPLGGVVKEIRVQDGQQVKKGDLLVRLDPTVARAQLASFNKIRATLAKENEFYRSIISNSNPRYLAQRSDAQLKIPIEIASLAESRKALIAENQLYSTQLTGDETGANLNPEQRVRLQFSAAELNSRVAANKLEVEQLEKQLQQNRIQLANSQSRFTVEEGILSQMTPLAEQGGVPRIQYLQQQQEVKTRKAEVLQLMEERGRLQLKMDQAKQQLKNTVALSQKDLTTQMATNKKQIAEIDTQLNKLIVENEKKIAEIEGQLSQTELNLSYQELRAPVSGTVFDLKPAGPGFVTNSTEPILKIVPEDTLVAKVYLTNKDIGFVREGMPVDVRIDSFPFSEFGDIKGKLSWIGSDALPPEQIRPFYSFPAKVQLNNQSLIVKERKIPLQSGMSVSVNIKVRDRTVLSIFTDLFSEKAESLKTVR